jgi:probable HAF family extracellular repeat protein
LKNGEYTLFDVPGGAISTWASGINDRGDIIGYYNDASGNQHGFLLQGGIGGASQQLDYPYSALPHDLSTLTVLWTAATGLNDHGQIVGTYGTSDGNNHGFLLSKGVYTTYDFLDSQGNRTPGNEVSGINDNGEVSGVYNYGFNAYIGTPVHGH